MSQLDPIPTEPPPRDGRNALLVGAAVLLAILLTWPFADAPFNDDWSYAFTVRDLLKTGSLHYNGWASASLVAQAYWGAAWCKAFGFSFAVLRLSTVPLAVAAASLCYGVARRAGLRPSMAVFAALLLGWSPLFLPVAATFMTDGPGLFLTLASLYLLIRAADADSPGAALGWLVAGMAVGGVGGTGRQIVWAVPLAVGPYAAWTRRRELAFAIATAVCWVAVLGGAVWTIRWFNRQMLTIPEPSPISDVRLAIHKPVHYVGSVIALVLTIAWVILPVTWPLVRGALAGRRRQLVAGAVFVALCGFVTIRHVEAARDARAHHAAPSPDAGHLWPYALAPWLPNTLDFRGVMDGSEIGGVRPVTLPVPVRLAFAIAVFAIVAMAIACLVGRLLNDDRTPTTPASEVPRRPGSNGPLAAALRFLVHPPPRQFALPAMTLFAAAYLALLLPRSARDMTFDRYVLPLMPALAVPLLLMAQRQGDRRPPRAAWALLAIYALYAVATTQEVTALARARNAAADRLLAAGVPATAIHASFEFDAITQLQQVGWINDPRIHPRWAYHRRTGPTPAVVPLYTLEMQPTEMSEPTSFGSVSYWSLMPPFRRQVSIDRYRDAWWTVPALAATRPAGTVRYGLPDAALPADYDAPDTPAPPGVHDER
jgi:hypothetical protein